MSTSLSRDAYSVLLPGFTVLELEDSARRFLEQGGASILLATDRREYLNREVSPARIATETADSFHSFLGEVRSIAGPVLVAVDQELGGTKRLHGLVPALPTTREALEMQTREIEQICEAVGKAAKTLGVSMFISPIVDVVTGTQPWLAGRAAGSDPVEVARLASAYIRGVQARGIVATAKHFPGFPRLWNDPAVEEAHVVETIQELRDGLETFKKVLLERPRAVMVGPAIVDAIDPGESASTSPIVVDLLRNECGYRGLIVSDDLDSKSVMRDDSLEEVAIRALAAGVDLLLLAGGPQLDSVANALVAAVDTGRIPRERLATAAAAVRTLALQFGGNCGSEDSTRGQR